jgi:hypothetical protein|eukprot:1717750-Prymnesium_polylepis.2
MSNSTQHTGTRHSPRLARVARFLNHTSCHYPRRCHGARARALLSLNPSAGWMHEPRLQSDVRVFEEDAPVTYVPTQMVRAVSVDERTIVSALRQMHDGRLSSVRSDEHFTVLEAFYSL